MSSAPAFNLDVLLAPLSSAMPCGSDARRDTSPNAVYFALKDARARARAHERQADSDEDTGTPLAHWQTVFDLCLTLLSEQAKDLEVAAWLIEASLRLHGFAGLRDGFHLAHGLIERYWDDLFPLPDEDGVAIRIAALGGLNGLGSEGTLIQALRKAPLTEPGGAEVFAFWHYMLANRPPAPAGSGRPPVLPSVTIEEIREAVRRSSSSFLRDLRDDLQAARTTFRLLIGALDQRCGDDAPPSSAIVNVLEEISDALDHLTEGAGLNETASLEPPAETIVEEDPAAPAALPPSGGPVRSREDALRQLQEVAEYFRRTEPHSPLSYTLDDLVRRGRMSLPELLVELLPDQGARNIFLTAAGIRPRQD